MPQTPHMEIPCAPPKVSNICLGPPTLGVACLLCMWPAGGSAHPLPPGGNQTIHSLSKHAHAFLLRLQALGVAVLQVRRQGAASATGCWHLRGRYCSGPLWGLQVALWAQQEEHHSHLQVNRVGLVRQRLLQHKQPR